MRDAKVTRDVHSISPEQQRALSVLHSKLPIWRTMQRDTDFSRNILTTNYVCFSTTPFKDLPTKNWVWNQSNGKITVQLTNDTLVTYQKMNTRKRKNFPKPPMHKLWVFTIESTDSSIPRYLYCVWCERGAHNIMPTAVLGNSQQTQCGSVTVIDHQESSADIQNETGDNNELHPDYFEILLAQLAFLKPFIEPSLAQELGW